jgi:hypothetical protein
MMMMMIMIIIIIIIIIGNNHDTSNAVYVEQDCVTKGRLGAV